MKSIVRILGVVLLILYGAFLNAEEIKGIHLKDEYLRIPFTSISEGKTYKHLNLTKGTIEFWVNPDWSWYGKKDKDIPFFSGEKTGFATVFVLNVHGSTIS